MQKRPKYGNRKVLYKGFIFDSAKERDRYITLMQRQQRGEISNLKTQVPFLLIPRLQHTETIKLKTKTKEVKKLDFAETKYIADFTYTDNNGNNIVEDVKGSKTTITPEFKIKQKLMLHIHGIKVKIILNPYE